MILLEKLQSNLKPIDHESLNKTFVGYSNLYQQSIFVKQFAKKQGCYTEETVTRQMNDRVITTFSIDNRYILILKDVEPRDIPSTIDQNLAFKMGQVLGEFHMQIKPFPKIKIVQNQFDAYLSEIYTFQDSFYKSQLNKVAEKFTMHKNEIQKDLKNNSHFVLHGDVGIRNYKYIGGKLTLIDFEKARLGPVYQDFIKLFYQDFSLNPDLIDSFLKGYSTKNSDYQLLGLTKQYLIFTTAVGIFNYTEKIEDIAFKKVGERMLASIEE
ncbi:hypothetical protein HYQ59_0925 [Lactobacillus crispatus]|uniref:phosphotransferase n=1 Tax=Lactobacillus crispatus TaxID=47770 RepID=UPI0018E35D79|nr:phosphotransferase [Lactobacillus crispatus]MBI1699579.1 hypothetical protein [Lactobacillus crispatus]